MVDEWKAKTLEYIDLPRILHPVREIDDRESSIDGLI